jgi:hypothetical protein
MRRWLTTWTLTGLILLPGAAAFAQNSKNHDDEDRPRQKNYSLGVGAGLVDAVNTETYLMAALRIRVNRHSDDEETDRGGGIRGYLEPEVGYWKSSSKTLKGTDTLVGVNLIGVVPFGKVDSFYGAGAGVHFLDAALVANDARVKGNDSKLGLNAQFGVDIYLTENLSAFGAGRFDLVQGDSHRTQSKVYLGLRARF